MGRDGRAVPIPSSTPGDSPTVFVYNDFREADLSGSNNAIGSSDVVQTSHISGSSTEAVQQAAAITQPIKAVRSAASTFVGRIDELDRLAALLDPNEGDPVTAIVGPPGVGKTELATHAAKAAMASGCFASGLYVAMRGYAENAGDRVVPERVYAPLLRGLGISGDDIPVTPSEQVLLYHDTMARLSDADSPVLLWLDDISDLAQIKSLLPASSKHRVLITSRETLGELGARLLEVGVLDGVRAVELLNSTVNDRNPGDDRLSTDSQSAAALAEICGYLPLALQIVAAIVADEPERPIDQVVSELRDESSRLDGLEYQSDWSVRAAFELSYRRLDEDHRRLFRLLALVPGGDASKAAASALLDEPELRTRQKLMRLVRAHLLEQHVLDRWQMHDLIRLYAAELVERDPAVASQAYFRLLTRYFGDISAAAGYLVTEASGGPKAVFGSVAGAADWLEAERATLVAIVLDAAGHTDDRRRIAAVNFAIQLGDLLKRDRYIDDWLTTATIAAQIASEIADKSTQGFALTNLGSALRAANQLPQALETHLRARAIYTELGNRRLLGVVLNNIANVSQQLGQFSEAIGAYEQDLVICEEIDDQRGEALTRTNLAAVLTNPSNRCSDPRRAVRELEAAIATFTRFGDQNGRARALSHLGAALVRLQCPEKAIEVLKQTTELHKAQRDRVGESAARGNLGTALMDLGEHEDSIPHFEFFLGTSVALGITSHELMARTNLGLALSNTGRTDAAVSYHEQAAKLAQQIGDRYHEATIRYNLGVDLKSLGGTTESRTEFLRAAELFEAIGETERAATICRQVQ